MANIKDILTSSKCKQINENHLEILARSGTLKQFKLGLGMYEERYDRIHTNPESLFFEALSSGNIEIVEYFLEMGLKPNVKDGAIDIAAMDGKIEAVEYGLRLGYKLTTKTCESAAYKGNLEMIKYLRSKGCGWNELNMIYFSFSFLRTFAKDMECMK